MYYIRLKTYTSSKYYIILAYPYWITKNTRTSQQRVHVSSIAIHSFFAVIDPLVKPNQILQYIQYALAPNPSHPDSKSRA
jgi:hypothetical protein